MAATALLERPNRSLRACTCDAQALHPRRGAEEWPDRCTGPLSLQTVRVVAGRRQIQTYFS